MKRRKIVTHIKSGMFWVSEWEDTENNVESSKTIEVTNDSFVSILKLGNTNIIIPPKIIIGSVQTIEYKED